MPEASRDLLAQAADGDARRALNLLEMAADLAEKAGRQAGHYRRPLIQEVITGGVRRFDKQGEAFYDQISALHKSVRGSDPGRRALLVRAHAGRRLRSALYRAAGGAHG